MSVAERGLNNDWWPRFSEEEYTSRWRRLRESMDQRGLDALLVFGTSIYFGTDPGSPNLVYLSGYAPACLGYVVFPREGDPTLLPYVPSHAENAKKLSVIQDVRAGNDIADLAVERLRELDIDGKTIGIVGNFDWSRTSIPLEHYQTLFDRLPNASLEVVTTWYEDHRLLKSQEELAFMEVGAGICDKAHFALREMAQPGVSDNSLHNHCLTVVHGLGGRIPFSHVGSTAMRNPELFYPDFYPTNRVVTHGDVILTELAAGYGGYFGKIYGTLVIGRPTPEYRTLLGLAIDIYRSIYDTVEAGISPGDLDGILKGEADAFGYESWSYVSGWSTYNTRPAQNRVARKADLEMELRPGHCLNIAGWVVDAQRRCGVWIGDTGVVEEGGLRRLHQYPVDDIDFITL